MSAQTRPPCAREFLVLAVAAGLLLPASGCGMLGRARAAREDALAAPDPDAARSVQGRDPLVATTWLAAAVRAEDAGRVDEAVALLDEGLRYLPRDGDLVLTRLLVLGRSGRVDEVVASAHAALGADPDDAFAAQLRWLLVIAELERGDVDAAEREAELLAGTGGRDDVAASAAFALVALAREETGEQARADAALDDAVRLATRGCGVLLDVAFVEPERIGALESLVARGRTRHPDHPDLLLFDAAVPLQQGDVARATARLAELRAAAPARMQRDVDLLDARLALLENQPEDALALVRQALDTRPQDIAFVAVLVELSERFGVPPADELDARLGRALPSIPASPLRAHVERLLAEG